MQERDKEVGVGDKWMVVFQRRRRKGGWRWRDVSEGSVEARCRAGGGDVRGLHNDSDPTRFDSLLHAEGDLLCKALLDLKTTAEGLCDACEFRDAQNELVWDVCYGNLRERVGVCTARRK